MCTELYKAMSSYLQGTICRETPPLMDVVESEISVARLNDLDLHAQGRNISGQFGLIDEAGELVAYGPSYAKLIEGVPV